MSGPTVQLVVEARSATPQRLMVGVWGALVVAGTVNVLVQDDVLLELAGLAQVACGALQLWFLRGSRLVFGDDELAVADGVRSRRLPFREIRSVDVVQRGAGLGVWYFLSFARTDGSRIDAVRFGSRDRATVDRLAAEVAAATRGERARST